MLRGQNDNKWWIRSLSRPWEAEKFLRWARERVDEPITLDLTSLGSVYPNGAVPLAATISYLNHTRDEPVEVLTDKSHTWGQIAAPLSIGDYERYGEHTLTNSVWCYRSESEAQDLASKFIHALSDKVRCEEGVIDSINWCLYEVMDNVFQHSHAEAGFVMMQLHRESRTCAISVADTGIGIQKSLALSNSFDRDIWRDPGASINHSLQQGVTSKGGQNQGNGLYGLRRSAEINGGQLAIHSGFGEWRLRDGKVTWLTDRTRSLLDQEHHQSTLVDWQLDCSTKVRIDEALGSRRPMESDFMESIENEVGVHVVSVAEIEESLGSRKLGSDIRTRIENYLNAGVPFVQLDFKGVGVISSSFADEVLAKLAVSMGELEFRRRVFVDSASVTNRSLIETAIGLRLAAREVDGGSGAQ